MKHTERGTCQGCGRVQAIGADTHGIADHGYLVRGGYWTGRCQGSSHAPAERHLGMAHNFHADAKAQLENAQKNILALDAGTLRPLFVRRFPANASPWFRGKDSVEVPFILGTPEEQIVAVKDLRVALEQTTWSCGAFIRTLEAFVFPRLGLATFPPKITKKALELKVGMQFKYATDHWRLDKPSVRGFWYCRTVIGSPKCRQFSGRRIREMIHRVEEEATK